DGIRREMTDSTLLLIAYRKSTISLADQVVFLDHGRVSAAGTHQELRDTSAGYRALVDAYDEAAISHNLLESSGPPPSDGPDPSVAVLAQRTRTVAGAVERLGSGQYRREGTDTGAIDLSGPFTDPLAEDGRPSAELPADEPSAEPPADGPGADEPPADEPGADEPTADEPDATKEDGR